MSPMFRLKKEKSSVITCMLTIYKEFFVPEAETVPNLLKLGILKRKTDNDDEHWMSFHGFEVLDD